jgi:hypothetical protein
MGDIPPFLWNSPTRETIRSLLGERAVKDSELAVAADHAYFCSRDSPPLHRLRYLARTLLAETVCASAA